MYQSTLVIILFRFFLAAFVIGTIWLLVKAVKNYQTSQESDKSLSLEDSTHKSTNAIGGRTRILFKTGVAFALWSIFSLYIFAVDLFASVGDKFGEEPLVTADSRTLGMVAAHILWFLAGLLLIYWLGKFPSKTSKLP